MFHMEHRDRFYVRWVERFARPPLPDENELFDIAKFFYEKGVEDADAARGVTREPKQYTPKP